MNKAIFTIKAYSYTCDISSDIFQSNRIFHGKPVRLAFDAALIDQNPGVSRKSGKSHYDVFVEKADLLHRPLLLQFGDSLLLDSKHDDVVSTHTHRSGSLLDGLLRVLDLQNVRSLKESTKLISSHLEEVSVWREHSDGPVIASRHPEQKPIRITEAPQSLLSRR
jgi:hypothetical protein